jgi:hypothetical protein
MSASGELKTDLASCSALHSGRAEIQYLTNAENFSKFWELDSRYVTLRTLDVSVAPVLADVHLVRL